MFSCHQSWYEFTVSLGMDHNRPSKHISTYCGAYRFSSTTPPQSPTAHSAKSLCLETFIKTASPHQIIEIRLKMCSIQMTTHNACRRNPQHQIKGDYLRCAVARARVDQRLCLPSSGLLRDLPLSVNTHVHGGCPACM